MLKKEKASGRILTLGLPPSPNLHQVRHKASFSRTTKKQHPYQKKPLERFSPTFLPEQKA